MNTIRILPENVINQIAAGEVVERPASVVKELVENALDAGANSIEVEIMEWGSRHIKVSDNGEGLTREDAILAIQKHSTSKIFSTEDITHLNTFGFRGEALASIASVSHFELSTRKKDSLYGTEVRIKGGKMGKITEIGRPPGTTVSIRNLFYNTPARLKFMKKSSTEENHIVLVVTTYALAFPKVGFKLIVDGREVVHTLPSDFKTRQSDILGRELSSSLLLINYQVFDIKISGAVSAPTITKPNRENMFLFVNNRWVTNPSLSHAVMTAFHTLLPIRRFPIVILFIDLPPEQVDVNVHPTKREVKFTQDRKIYETVVQAVRNALVATTGTPIQSTDKNHLPLSTFTLGAITVDKIREHDFFSEPKGLFKQYDHISHKRTGQNSENVNITNVLKEETVFFGKTEMQIRRIDPEVSLYNFNQLFNTFIIFQSDSEMFIADQHTVHERLNYERLMKNILEKKLAVQPLLVPVAVELNPREANVVRKHLDLLHELGLEVTSFGGNTYMVHSIPADLADKNIMTLVKDLVDDLVFEDSSDAMQANRLEKIRERAVIFLSCRSAVMAGDHLNEEQMKGLIEQMRQANLPFTCPHGRPTIFSISLSELYRRFERH